MSRPPDEALSRRLTTAGVARTEAAALGRARPAGSAKAPPRTRLREDAYASAPEKTGFSFAPRQLRRRRRGSAAQIGSC